VLRFWDSDALGNTDGVLTRIAEALTASQGHPSPRPSPQRGEGAGREPSPPGGSKGCREPSGPGRPSPSKGGEGRVRGPRVRGPRVRGPR
jgi:hypothetical protein